MNLNSLYPHAPKGSRIPVGGEMFGLIEGFDWAKTAVGAISGWPAAFAVTTRNMLNSRSPMVMAMGETGVLIYNDAYAVFAGARHPALLGADIAVGWPEIADFNTKLLARTLAGETVVLKRQNMTLNRTGEMEEVWLDLEYGPVMDRTGKPIGELVTFSEITDQVLAEKALERSEESLSFALSASGMVGVWDWDIEADRVTADANFAQMFGVEPERALAGTPIATFVDAVHPGDRDLLRKGIDTSIETGGDFRMEYRLLTSDGSIAWVLAFGRPAFDSSGKPQRLPGVVVDITAQKAQEMAIAQSEAKFRAIANTLPQMVWSTLADGYHDYYNDRWYEFTGVPPGSTDGVGWNNVFHPDDQDRAWRIWRHSLATGEAYSIEYRLRHKSGAYRWTLGQALPIRDEEGQIVRWFGSITDIHEAKIAAEEREIIAQELSHRIKNIFAVISGLISLTVRSNPEFRELGASLRDRISALSTAHDLVRSDAAGISDGGSSTVKALLMQMLKPYGNVAVLGDDAAIDDRSATPLSLLFHELATNAAKYGGLRDDGRLEVTLNTSTNVDTLEILWDEFSKVKGANPALATTGFGTRLISLALESQLSGSIERQWSTDGLRAVIRMPLVLLKRD